VAVPCFQCDARQTDPVRGASPWSRAVAGGEQVLVCPDCQADGAWRTHVDRCGGCGSVRLAKALGLTRCRDCGEHAAPRPFGADTGLRGAAGLDTDASAKADDVTRTTSGPAAGTPDRPARELSAEVSAALARILGQAGGTDRPPGPRRQPGPGDQ
jgi:hypothetical protein